MPRLENMKFLKARNAVFLFAFWWTVTRLRHTKKLRQPKRSLFKNNLTKNIYVYKSPLWLLILKEQSTMFSSGQRLQASKIIT